MANNSMRQSIIGALKYNKDGSYAGQAARREILLKITKELRDVGYNKVTPKNFGERHAVALVAKWQQAGLAVSTLKNRMSALRWYATKIGKPDVIPSKNKDLGIGRRVHSDNSVNRAKELDPAKLEKLTDRQQLSVQLQRVFGLRREESLKFQPKYADQGSYIKLKDSWCKGGRARDVPIETKEQKELLLKCHEIAKSGSMIVKEQKYIEARNNLDYSCGKVGLSNNHGYRHMYAQVMYKDLTGRDCPKAGGLISKELSEEEKAIDYDARMKISINLGHAREEITMDYLGR